MSLGCSVISCYLYPLIGCPVWFQPPKVASNGRQLTVPWWSWFFYKRGVKARCINLITLSSRPNKSFLQCMLPRWRTERFGQWFFYLLVRGKCDDAGKTYALSPQQPACFFEHAKFLHIRWDGLWEIVSLLRSSTLTIAPETSHWHWWTRRGEFKNKPLICPDLDNTAIWGRGTQIFGSKHWATYNVHSERAKID